MADTILYDSAMRLFAAEVSPAVVQDVEQGLWPDALWQAVEEAGYLDVLVDGPANMPGNMVEAATILRAAGHHAAPIPLVETMLARFLCAAAQLPAPAGVLTIAPVEPGERLAIGGGAVSGRAGHVPWGLVAEAIVVVGEREVALVSGGALSWDASDNLAYESRDHMSAAGARGDIRPLPDGIDAALVLRLGALMRAAQMAGAMEAALAITTQYANERVQFGRAIGKFQAIQQQMGCWPSTRRRPGSRWRTRRARSPRGGNRRNSPAPRRKSAPARPPGRSPRSPIRCMAPSASPRSIACTR